MAVKGWVRTKRDQKTFSFVEVNDGSCMKGVQVRQGERERAGHRERERGGGIVRERRRERRLQRAEQKERERGGGGGERKREETIFTCGREVAYCV